MFAARALEVVEQLRQPAERFLPVLRPDAGRVAQRDRQLRQDALAQFDAFRLPQGFGAARQQSSALLRRERQAEALRHGVPAQQCRLDPLRGQRAESCQFIHLFSPRHVIYTPGKEKTRLEKLPEM